MITYEGPKSYAFVSYSHGDYREIEPILNRLHDVGCRLWYDNGINPGSEWPEYVATKILKCKLVILFLSKHAVQSVNVRSEIALARSHDIPFLCIHLDNSPLSPGMELQIGLFQHIFHEINGEFGKTMEKIRECQLLYPCLELSKTKRNSSESTTTFFSKNGFYYVMRLISPATQWGDFMPILLIEQRQDGKEAVKKLLEIDATKGSQLFEEITIQAVREEHAGVFDETDHDRIIFELQFIREHIDFDIGIGERAYSRNVYEIVNPFSSAAECNIIPELGKSQTIQKATGH